MQELPTPGANGAPIKFTQSRQVKPSDIFKPHGTYSARVDGRVLVCTATGSWNLEMQQEAMQQSMAAVSALNDAGHWACIVEVRGSVVSSLAVLEAGRNAVSDGTGVNNLVCLAWVIAPNVEGYPLMLPRLRKIYEGILEAEIFNDIDAAGAWVAAMLERQAGNEK